MKVEFWGGPMDGEVVSGNDFKRGECGHYFPLIVEPPKTETQLRREAQSGVTTSVVLCRYQIFSDEPDHRGMVTAEFVGWEE